MTESPEDIEREVKNHLRELFWEARNFPKNVPVDIEEKFDDVARQIRHLFPDKGEPDRTSLHEWGSPKGLPKGWRGRILGSSTEKKRRIKGGLMNYRALIEGKHSIVCSFCYLWTPKARNLRQGYASVDFRQYICGKGSIANHERELINEPCLEGDWLICPLNP